MSRAKKITPRDLIAQTQQLIDSGRMPSLGQVLKAVSETRRKYVPQILAARGETEAVNKLEGDILAFENWQSKSKT
jgi:hypothetical protein